MKILYICWDEFCGKENDVTKHDFIAGQPTCEKCEKPLVTPSGKVQLQIITGGE